MTTVTGGGRRPAKRLVRRSDGVRARGRRSRRLQGRRRGVPKATFGRRRYQGRRARALLGPLRLVPRTAERHRPPRAGGARRPGSANWPRMTSRSSEAMNLYAEFPEMLTCRDCGGSFPHPGGAGRRPPRCAACKLKTQRRGQRERRRGHVADRRRAQPAPCAPEPPSAPAPVSLASAPCGTCGDVERSFRDDSGADELIRLRCWQRRRAGREAE